MLCDAQATADADAEDVRKSQRAARATRRAAQQAWVDRIDTRTTGGRHSAALRRGK